MSVSNVPLEQDGVQQSQAFVAKFRAPVIAATATAAFPLAASATTVREAAQHYAAAGFAVLPWKPRFDKTRKEWEKKPDVGTDWITAVSGAADPVGQWWPEGQPEREVGILLTAGYVVVDIDGDEGLDTFLRHVADGALPDGPRVQTGRGWQSYPRGS